LLDSKTKIETFVNRALFKLVNDVWTSVNGDPKLFLQILPELGDEENITTTVSGTYVIGTSAVIRDFFRLLDARLSTTYIEAVEPHLLEEFLTDKNTERIPTAAIPYVYEQGGTLYFLPAASFNAQVVYVHYLRLPISSVNGAFITSGGSIDSPFYDHWNSKIAEIAAQIFFGTSGEM